MAKNLFNSVQMTRPKKNVFDLSHDVKTSCNMGQLVPTLCMEVVPGDKINLSCEALIRFAPMVAPVMHRYDVTTHYFFVPNRLLWDNWENFIMQKKVAGVIPAFPTWLVDGDVAATYTKLLDYLGVPTPIAGQTEIISALPMAGYQLIFNEFYRDQGTFTDLADVIKLVDGNNTEANLKALRKRAWEHDYFTSALVTAQADNAVDVPFGDVVLKDDWETHGQPVFRDEDDTVAAAGFVEQNAAPDIRINPTTDPIAYDPQNTLTSEGSTISDLRRAFKLQEWYEKALRGGRRYVENILTFFGVRNPDSRLQRPEYITGVKSPIVISEVLQTSETAGSPQGNMSGHGVGVQSGRYGSYFVPEHGYIFGIMSIMPKTAYQQGLPKHFDKTLDAFQYFWPQFEHIGEQEIRHKEIYAFQGITGNTTFGYIPRYAEYKFMNSMVTGEFRDTLDFWHNGRIFATPPVLNAAFIECTPDFRIFAVTDPDEDHMWCHVYHKIKAVRPMSKYGSPSF